MRNVGEAPPSRDDSDRALRQRAVEQVGPQTLESAMTDPSGDGRLGVRLEEAVQGAQCNMVCRGDGLRVEARVAEPRHDEGLYSREPLPIHAIRRQARGHPES